MRPKSTNNVTYPFHVSFKRRLTQWRGMAKVKKFSSMQLFSSGLSPAKRTVLEKYIDDIDPDFITLTETKQRIPHDIFKNYPTFSHHQQAHHDVVALFLPKDITCCEYTNFQKTSLYLVCSVLWSYILHSSICVHSSKLFYRHP